jgi:hypothetical protein
MSTTPLTTEELRQIYATRGQLTIGMRAQRAEEFDTWLAERDELATAAAVARAREPRTPGWYRAVNGADVLLFSLSEGSNGLVWHAHTVNGSVTPCVWDYIDQVGDIERVLPRPRQVRVTIGASLPKAT